MEMIRGLFIVEIDTFWIAVGLAALGYFIDLHYHFNLSKGEIEELLDKYPDAPKIELKGTTYYPYQQFIDWLSSNDIYKR